MSLSPYARGLVRRASTDAPSADRRERARKRFAEASIAAVAGAAASAKAASTVNKSSAMLSSAKLVVWAKIVGVLALAVGAAALIATREDTPEKPVPAVPVAPAPTPTPTPPESALAVPTVSAPSATIELPAPPVVAPAPTSETKAVRPDRAPSVAAEGASKKVDPLQYEAGLLEAARACLAAADVACARTRLNEHARIEHPRLPEEAAVLNIEVLRAEGRRDDARKAAALFVEQRPTSPYAKRVRVIARQLNEDPR